MSSSDPSVSPNAADAPGTLPKRRDLLGLSALWTAMAAFAAAIVGIARLPKPSVLPGPRRVYRTGSPEDFAVGSVTQIGSGSAFLYRDENGFHAISAVCTHLGCTVKRTEQDGFSCPCHGSQFDSHGSVVRGPAPSGLPWLRVSLLASGDLEVDADAEVPHGSTFEV